MSFLYYNACNIKEDVISRAFEYENNIQKQLYFINCPVLPHSHVDATYVIDNNIVPRTASFNGVIRNPYERQLSLYFYRMRNRNYGETKPSVDDFRSKFIAGILQDKPQQMQSQISFLKYKNKILGNYWLFENINNHLHALCEAWDIPIIYPIKNINMSPGNKKELIDIFYTSKLKQAVLEHYREDFAKYEELKDIYRI